jgi:dihydroxyacetone kinase-like protein
LLRVTANSEKIIQVLEHAAKAMSENRAVLTELDSAIGDGDLGITMEKGFTAAALAVRELSTEDPGSIFMKAGMTMSREAPSTMGTLIATGLMRGGKAIAARQEISVPDMKVFLAAFLQGVMDRGKAKPGEKTLVDVLVPAVEAMKSFVGDDVALIWKQAEEGAARGIEAARDLEAQHGKAAVFRKKTIGLEDPGGRAVYLMIKSFAEVLNS